MNKYMIIIAIALIALIIVTAGITMATNEKVATTETCTSCGNNCIKDSNCGLSTCNAINGGRCNCGKK
jgi:hypothetical protein